MSWKPAYAILIASSTLIDYFCGIYMAKKSEKKNRRWFLLLSMTTNIGVLVFFKYFNFINQVIEDALGYTGWSVGMPELDILLPVGISFYTFQAMSYSIDVYRGNTQPEKHLGYFALFISFFPQLVAGPIERTKNLLPQLKVKHQFSYHQVVSGLRLVTWGLFKKVVIADQVAVAVNSIYGQHEVAGGGWILVAQLLFTVQIYCDFSGYSDIAIGTARMLGINFKRNFNRPFFSKSIKEFWSRWHISLSTWFKDYLYIPLGGNRKVKWRWYYNLFITFLISGLWHGANWTFLVWGGIHGLVLVFETMVKYRTSKSIFIRAVQMLTTVAIVIFAFHFFRADSIHQAMVMNKKMMLDFLTMKPAIIMESSGMNWSLLKVDWLVMALAISTLFGMEVFQRNKSLQKLISSKPRMLRWSMYYVAIMAIILMGNYEGMLDFIYFQF
ncbi:MAG: alginate O-acetyltransferase complex protein AlgI [Parvicellaceae bacterium]|jgi:alginate O-acetyltransferase complex protein AlgI